jgi:hypothetical protein
MSLRSVIKSWFQTGDVPTETQYSDTFDSTVIWDDDVKTTTAGNADNEVPTTKAVNDAIALVDLQQVTDIGAETNNPLLVRQAGDTQNLFRKNGILHTSEATGGTSTWLSFNTPTGTGSIAIQDAVNGAETLAFLSDIPASGVQSVSGTTVDNTDPINPVVNVPTLQQVTDAGNQTDLIKVTDYSNIETWVTPTGFNHIDASNDVSIEFVPPTGNFGVIQFQDVAGGTETVAFLSDIPPAGGAAWGAITGSLSSQTDLQTALDGKVDENAPITGATKTKITYNANGLVTAGADATTADIADSTNKRYVTDAQQTVIDNTSGTNTGDQNLSGLMVKANNLSDLTNTTTARTNLGIDAILPTIANIGSDGTNTSGTTETVCQTALIASTKVAAGMVMNVEAMIKKSAANGTVTMRFYVNSTANLSGSPILVGVSAAMVAGTRFAMLVRSLRIKATSGAGTEITNTAYTSAAETTAGGTNAVSTVTIDWTTDKYLVVSIQNSSASDTSTVTFLRITK